MLVEVQSGNKITKKHKHILSLLFSYDFQAPVWRIRIDTACQRLAVEVRDPDLLLTYFYTVDTRGFALSKLEVNPSKAWWQGLEDAQYGQVYLHSYGDRKTGQHKGITAIDAQSSSVSWMQEELAFYGLAEAGMLAYKADAPEEPLTALDPGTGDILRSGISQQQAADLAADFSETRYRNCGYPVVYREGEPYYEEVCNFLKVQSGAKPVMAVEYAEANSCIVVSYYEEAAAGKLDNFVAVYDIEGNLVLKVKLGSGLSGIGSDTFFIFNLDLYLLLDKQILQVYRLLA